MDETTVAKLPQKLIGTSHAALGAGAAARVGAEATTSGSPDESKWVARLVGAGCLLTLVYELAYLGFDRGSLWMSHAWPLFLHLLNIGLYLVAVIMTLRVGPWMRRHWKVVAFTFSTILITSSMWLAIITDESEPLFVALMLFLAGTGPFLSWGERIQGLLSVVAIIAFTLAATKLPIHTRSHQITEREIGSIPMAGDLDRRSNRTVLNRAGTAASSCSKAGRR